MVFTAVTIDSIIIFNAKPHLYCFHTKIYDHENFVFCITFGVSLNSMCIKYLPARPQRIAAHFIFTMRTLLFAIAQRCPRHTPSTHLTPKRLLGTFLGGSQLFKWTFFIGSIITIWSPITNEIPANAHTARTTLKCASRTSSSICSTCIVGCVVRMLVGTIATPVLIAISVWIGQLTRNVWVTR